MNKQRTVVTIDSLKYIMKPILLEICKSMIFSRDPELKSIHDSFCDKLSNIVGKRHMFFIDDGKHVVKNILNDEDSFLKHGEMLFDHIKQWVIHPKTQWDYELLREPLNIFKAELLIAKCELEPNHDR